MHGAAVQAAAPAVEEEGPGFDLGDVQAHQVIGAILQVALQGFDSLAADRDDPFLEPR